MCCETGVEGEKEVGVLRGREGVGVWKCSEVGESEGEEKRGGGEGRGWGVGCGWGCVLGLGGGVGRGWWEGVMGVVRRWGG